MILLIFFCFLLQSTLFQNIFAAAEIAPNFMVILTVSFGPVLRKRPGLYGPSLCDHRILLRFLLPYFLR